MNNRPNVKIVLCRCGSNGKLYGMRTEEVARGEWHINWAFPVSEKRAKAEKYDGETIQGRILLAREFPGCPYCGNGGFFSCGGCGKLTCWNQKDDKVKCANCNSNITLTGTIDKLNTGNDV